jgi:hypothetical protein
MLKGISLDRFFGQDNKTKKRKFSSQNKVKILTFLLKNNRNISETFENQSFKSRDKKTNSLSRTDSEEEEYGSGEKETSFNSRKRIDGNTLNGAQFIAAASVGNLILDDNCSQMDLNKLYSHIDRLSKTLNQHSVLFNKISNSIEQLSNKLDTAITILNDQQQKKESSTSRPSYTATSNRKATQNIRFKSKNKVIPTTDRSSFRNLALKKSKILQINAKTIDGSVSVSENELELTKPQTIKTFISPVKVSLPNKNTNCGDDKNNNSHVPNIISENKPSQSLVTFSKPLINQSDSETDCLSSKSVSFYFQSRFYFKCVVYFFMLGIKLQLNFKR